MRNAYIRTYIHEMGNECMRWDFKYKCKTTIVPGLAKKKNSNAKISTNYLHEMLEVSFIGQKKGWKTFLTSYNNISRFHRVFIEWVMLSLNKGVNTQWK